MIYNAPITLILMTIQMANGYYPSWNKFQNKIRTRIILIADL
jgi:hypothetical protein